jgi:predicted transcriptional regulator
MTWAFLTNHAQALLCIAEDPGVRLRDIASSLGITERAAYGIVADLVGAGYVHKAKQGRRNHYSVQGDKPLPEALLRQRTVEQLVNLLTPTDRASRVPGR